MFYITGDMHQDFSRLYFYKNLTHHDTILILGDMGLFWRKDKKDSEYYIKELEKNINCNIWFIDGNHENFDHLKGLPKDGNISRYIRYISRGTEFYIDGKRCLAIGGADSVDKNRRIPHLSWWKDEQITQEEVDNIIKKYKNKHFDYVFTHAAPRKVVEDYKQYLCTLNLDEEVIDHTSENRLQQIADNISFDHWYFGHYHVNLKLNDKYTCLYEKIEGII